MIKVSDSVFFESKYLGCNVCCIITGEGLILIDTPALPSDAREWRMQIEQMTGKKIAWTIYTHEHFDHVLGSSQLTDNIIAHQAAVEDIEYLKTHLAQEITAFFPDIYKMYKEIWDTTEVIAPRITFSDRLCLEFDRKKIELSWTGGHSPGSIQVFIPEENILFCGDLADKGMPFVTPYSKFNEWINALRRIEMMEIETILPGHGEACSKDDIKKVRVYFETMRQRLMEMKRVGMTKNKALDSINLDDCLPVPKDNAVAQRIIIDAGLMWKEIQISM